MICSSCKNEDTCRFKGYRLFCASFIRRKYEINRYSRNDE